MELSDFTSGEFMSNLLSHQCDLIKAGKLKLIDPATRTLADKERMAHKQAILEREMAKAYKRNKSSSPLLST